MKTFNEIQLPPWYDNGKYYEIVKDFKVFDFFNNLTIRYLITGFLCDEGKFSSQIKNVKPEVFSNNHRIMQMIEDWAEKPLEIMPSDLVSKYFENARGEPEFDNSHLPENKFRDGLYKKTIHPLSWREVKQIDLTLKRFSNVELSKKEKELLQLHLKDHVSMFNVEKELESFHKSIKKYLKDEVFDVMYEPISLFLGGIDSYDVQINLDMRSPDIALIEDFKSLLSQLRKIDTFDFDGGRENNPVSLGRWVDFKIFEYIDLAIWFAVTGQNVTDPQMGNILYPDELNKDVTAIIRGSTRKYVDKALTDRFHEKLYWEAWTLSN